MPFARIYAPTFATKQAQCCLLRLVLSAVEFLASTLFSRDFPSLFSSLPALGKYLTLEKF